MIRRPPLNCLKGVTLLSSYLLFTVPIKRTYASRTAAIATNQKSIAALTLAVFSGRFNEWPEKTMIDAYDAMNPKASVAPMAMLPLRTSIAPGPRSVSSGARYSSLAATGVASFCVRALLWQSDSIKLHYYPSPKSTMPLETTI